MGKDIVGLARITIPLCEEETELIIADCTHSLPDQTCNYPGNRERS